MPIRLSKEKQEKENIQLLIKQSLLNPKYELECIIGGNARLGSVIEQDQFNRILGRIRNKPEYNTIPAVDKLTVCFPADSKYSDVRVIITGYHNINKYCLTEKIDGILDNVRFQVKRRAAEKVNRVMVANYGLRFNQKLEDALDIDSGLIRELMRDWPNILKIFRYKQEYRHLSPDGQFSIDCSIVRNSAFEDREISVQEVFARDLVRNVIKPRGEKSPFGEWWRSISKDRKTMVRVRDVNVYYKSVKDSRLFESSFLYEVEVEYIGNQLAGSRKLYIDSRDKDSIMKSVFNGMFGHIGLLLQCIQDSFHIMGANDLITVTSSYGKLTNVARGVDKMFFGPLPVDLDRNNLIRLPNYDEPNRVYAAGNVLLDYCVCDKIDGMRNLLYLDKVGNCYLIGRDSAVTVRDMGLRIPAFANSVFDGEHVNYDKDGNYINRFYIFDAFFVRGDSLMRKRFGHIDDEESRMFYVSKLAARYDSGDGVEHAPGVSSKYAFKIAAQTYLYGERSTTEERRRNYGLILEHAATLLGRMNKKYGGTLEEGHMFTYKTDGLIFKPVELGIYQTKPDNEVPEDILSASRKWNHLFKRKPKQLLTMDLRVEFLKDIKSRRRIYVHLNNRKYAKCVLKARNYNSYEWQGSSEDGKKINRAGGRDKRIESYLGMVLVNDNTNLYNMPGEVEFRAVHPFVGYRDVMGDIQASSHECLIPVDGNDTARADNGDIIYDKHVVEFQYTILSSGDVNTNTNLGSGTGVVDPGRRWHAVKVRANKSPNDLNTCLDIWRLIHTTSTSEPISTTTTTGFSGGSGSGATDSLIDPEERARLMNPAYDSKNLSYYLPGGVSNAGIYAPELYRFTNFAKQWLLDKYMSMFTGPRVIDLGCGKLTDFFKYVHGEASMLLAIDSNPDNLNNKYDGAAVRIVNNIRNSPRIKQLAARTWLLLGDICGDLQSGDMVGDELNKYYLDVLMGRHQPSQQFNSKHGRFYGVLQDGFHMAVSMYSLQHCLNSQQHLDTFLANVADMLKDQGYWLGCCLDGNEIASDLARGAGQVEGRRDGNLVWSVRLVESGEQFLDANDTTTPSNTNIPNDGTANTDKDADLRLVPGATVMGYSVTDSPQMLGAGNTIDVYQETHATAVRQNLVDMQYVAIRAQEHGLRLVETRRFTEEPGSLVTEWASSIEDNNSNPSSRNGRSVRSIKANSKAQELAKAVKALKTMPVLDKWASWQRYFVFQKHVDNDRKK